MSELSLDDMFLEHVLHKDKSSHNWDDNLLHISDIGGCPRAVAFRLMGDATREMYGEELRKKVGMYYLANWIHDEFYSAWAESGILVEKECNISGYLPDGWVGRFDAVIDYGGGRRIADVKTKAFIGKTSLFPQVKHTYQVLAYHMYIAEEYKLDKNPILLYIQRDLQHVSAKECTVDVTEESMAYIKYHMSALEAARDALPNLPDILPRTMKYTGKKVKGNYMSVSACTNSQCTSTWCDYAGTTCQPDVGEDLVAWRNGEDWVLVESQEQYQDSFLAFLEGEEFNALEGD